MNENLEKHKQLAITVGDAEAWRRLLASVIPVIYRMFLSRWPNHSLAEELTQKTIFDAIRGRKTYDAEKAAPEAWITGIARNNIALEGRRRAARPSIDGNLAAYIKTLNNRPLPDEILERKETRALIREALNALESKERDALRAKYIEQLSARQIAKEMGITEKAVHSLLYRARLSLRDKLKQIMPLGKEGPKL